MFSAIPAKVSDTTDTKVSQHLTESILTLQQTIKNIEEDVQNGIAPSIILPADSPQDLNSGMLLLALDPSPSDIFTHLTPLSNRLADLEESLRARSNWRPPPSPPKSPEYSIIDISDLSSAVDLLEDIAKHAEPASPISARPALSKYEWVWDPEWKEFYASTEEAQLYLSRWRLDEARAVWEHVSGNAVEMEPDEAAGLLGSWEDWTWDALWREWYLDVGDEEGQCRVYASRWEVRANGQWVYVGRMGGL